MKKKSKDRVEAEVILRSANPAVGTSDPVRAKTARQRDASPQAVEKVVSTLRDLGFEVLAHSANSVSIAGTSDLFEKTFKTATHRGQDEPLKVPEEISKEVEGVFVQRPPTYFDP